MSNKIALATIQFRADAKGANAALDSLRMSADNARRTMKEMQDALDRGVKTMKSSSGVEFNVAERLKSATREAKNFEAAIRELMKGATALESVVKNIEMGEIEKSSRAELKGAINAAESRKRSVRGDDEESLKMQRELNIVIEESRKQLNNLDRDTQKVIETLKNGGTIAESVLSKEQKGLQEILAMIPKGTEEYKQYAEQLKEIQTYVANIRQQEQAKATSLLSDKNLGKYSEEQIRAAIDAGRQLIQTYKTASPEAQALADNIVRAEQHLKNYGVEAARIAAKEAQQIKTQEEAEKQLQATMNKRLRNLSTLSTEALAETHKYWETQRNGAEMGSAELTKYEAKLKRVMNQEQKRQVAQLDSILTQPNQHGVAEVRQAVQEMEKLRDSVRQGSNAWLHYNKMVEQGKAYLDGLAKADALNKINTQMQSLNTLSVSGLAEVKKYWETMVAGAERGSQELDEYKAKLKDVEDEEKNRIRIDSRQTSSILTSGGDLGRYSENEIRAAIEAGNRLIKTYQTASPEAEILAMHIVRAEEHLKQYGVEAERTAAREAKAVEEANRKRQETNQLMEDQLRRGTGLTESALKQQEQYWQRLADDPKAAAREIAYYFEQLNKVKDIQKQQADTQVKVGGISVLQNMRGDVDYESKISENQRKEDISALKAYRDSLPKDGNLSLLQEIDYYLKQLGASAKEAGQDIMSVNDALVLAGKAGTDAFVATPQEIQMATKAIEKQRDAIIQTIKIKRESGAATDAEEKELADLTKKLRDLKFEQDNFNMSQAKMQELMRTPTNAVSLDELRDAIKRADGELKRMEGSLGQNNAKYKAFAEQVKNAKNQLKEMEGQAKATSTAWEKAWSRLKTYVGMYMGFNMAWQKVTGTADDLLELSDKMGEVRKTTGFTADEVGRLSDNLAKLDTRTDLTGLMEFSSLAGSIGMKTQEQVQGFTEAANMLAVSLPEMGNEASRTLMKIADATGDLEKNGGNVRETLERVGSTIIALRANSAAAAGPITDFVSRVGAVGAQAGISIDQIAALGATVDALGGRVEMSATALSRMIPAIKNNTFEVAKAIGMTEKELKNMTGMEQMVAIFRKLHDSTKGFDTSTEEGMNAMADSVEKALGRSTSMQEVMKELNQQGARAGIVFGLLSQNVDKLEEQLDTASEAYSKNVALMNEYSKMNDTAAAKWARLKNQIEEFFVTAGNTSWLGSLIDKLRIVVDLLTDEGPIGSFFRYTLFYLALVKAKWAETFGTALISLGKFLFATKASTAASAADTAAKTAEAAATEAVGNSSADAAVKTGLFAKAWGKMNAAMRANIITAVAMAVWLLGSKLLDVAKNSREAAQRIDQVADAEKKAKEESIKERAELEKLYKVTQDRNKSLDERKKALHEMVGDEKYNQYYKDLANESELAKAAANEYSNLTTEIIKAAKARAYQQKITELTEKNLALEEKRDEAKKYVDDNKASYERVSTNVANSPTPAGMFGMAAAAAQEHNDGRRKFLRDYEAKQQDIITNQEEMKKNDEDILKLETKINELNLKSPSAGNGGDGGSGGGGGGNNSPYGNYDRVKSDYNDWDANALVARRKEMLERVRALANGADVQKVLSEDAKFISDAVRKNIKTTSDAIEWYNTERLKIQDALHAKHLTNTGDWMDPKKQKIRRKLMQDDMKAYLEELDAYYTDRKTEIDRARNDEEISEAEAWNRNIKNEAEWHRRRAELQIMYSNKHKQIAEDEQNTISAIIAERTGDDAKYIKATIANTRKFSEAVKAMNDQGAKEYRKFQGDLDLGSEKDWNKVEKALTRHLKAIEEIINKERPFNGIAKNMQNNLGKMGILTADLTEGADSAAEELKRITFLLGEAENAYTMTVENLLDDMRQNGFKEWADVVSKDPSMQQGLLAMLRQTFDSVQDAIKKESSIIKKQVEIMMQDITEQVQADTTRMQILQNSVQRANQLIGAGPASERVADKLAIKQTQLQITLQETRIRMLKKAGADRVTLLMQEADLLQKQGKLEEAKQKRMDAENVNKSVGLTLTKEQAELDKQRISLAEKLEESQNRLYTSLREWADLLTSSLQGVFEASHAGDAEYYNERAKLELTGKGGPGAGTYMVIENEGTEDAKAHYEYLDERQALERQREIENDNAVADAWRKVMDDINQKMNDAITDQINAMLQNASTDANTDATLANTRAIAELTAAIGGQASADFSDASKLSRDKEGFAMDEKGQTIAPIQPADQADGIEIPSYFPRSEEERDRRMGYQEELWDNHVGYGTQKLSEMSDAVAEMPSIVTDPVPKTDEELDMFVEKANAAADAQIAASDRQAAAVTENAEKQKKAQTDANNQAAKSTQSSFAKMVAACNMYGIAYQAMSNDNLNATEKFQMFALQAAGQTAIGMLTTNMLQTDAQSKVELPGILGKAASQLGPIAGPIAFAAMTALLGGLMGMAMSKVGKAKSQISQVTGASASAGRLSTGMLTYAEGNVNEFTDPDSLTPGRHYNVDGADGRTYRAKYTGKNAKTHITSGPEFHLVGEKGREAIIDAHTTRNIQMNEPEIWRSIQTLYNGGRITNSRVRRGRGVSAFADGNLDDFEGMDDSGFTVNDSGLSPEMIQGFQSSLDRNSAVMERIEANGIHAYFDVYGKGGLVDSYDTGKKTAKSHGEKY